jgi:hypothetical protein
MSPFCAFAQVYQEISITGDMKTRWMLDRREGRLGKAHKLPSEEMPVFIGIDYHKAYSVYSVLDAQGESLGQVVLLTPIRRISALVRQWPGCRVVFEAGMNWH